MQISSPLPACLQNSRKKTLTVKNKQQLTGTMLVCIVKSAASSGIYSKVLQLKQQSVHHARMIALATSYIYFVTCLDTQSSYFPLKSMRSSFSQWRSVQWRTCRESVCFGIQAVASYNIEYWKIVVNYRLSSQIGTS